MTLLTADYTTVALALALLTFALVLFPALKPLPQPKKLYPPGPKRLPILGNLLDFPKTAAWKKFAQWSKELDSDVIYLDVVGMPLVVLNSLEAATDLLHKRSLLYSSRLQLAMTHELLEGRRFFVAMPYGDEWRESRRIMSKYISTPDQTILSRTRDFVRKGILPNFLDYPEDFFTHFRNGIGGSVLSLTYGLRIKRVNDSWIALADEAMDMMTVVGVPGAYAVDLLPFLKHVPEWMPGAGFQRVAREGRTLMRRFFGRPFETAKKNMAEGMTGPCFILDCLEDVGRDGDSKRYQEKLIENVGGTFIGAGSETSTTALKTFMAVLLLYPNVQARAQAEIDAVVGQHRLPDFDDKPNLPYLRALLKEVLRWEPIVPMGIPHMSTEDDTYRGYYIPKDSLVIGNTWAIFHDENNFANPSSFDPTRFLTPSGELRTDDNILDPEEVATFGFGRRICPGSEFGLAALWITAASILACFNVAPPLNEDGKEEVPHVEFLHKQVVSPPEPFRCRITPHSKEIVAHIRAGYDETSEYI